MTLKDSWFYFIRIYIQKAIEQEIYKYAHKTNDKKQKLYF